MTNENSGNATRIRKSQCDPFFSSYTWTKAQGIAGVTAPTGWLPVPPGTEPVTGTSRFNYELNEKQQWIPQ
jgi:hypothetical protein